MRAAHSGCARLLETCTTPAHPPRATIRKWDGTRTGGRDDPRTCKDAQNMVRFDAFCSHPAARLGSDGEPLPAIGPAASAFEEPVFVDANDHRNGGVALGEGDRHVYSEC